MFLINAPQTCQHLPPCYTGHGGHCHRWGRPSCKSPRPPPGWSPPRSPWSRLPPHVLAERTTYFLGVSFTKNVHEMLSSLCCWVTVADGDSTFRLGWETVRINQFTSHSLRFHIDSHWSQIEVWECVRGKIGQVGVDRLKQVTPRWVLVPLPHSSGRHYYLDMLNLSSPLFDQKRPSFPTLNYLPQQLTAHWQALLPGYA